MVAEDRDELVSLLLIDAAESVNGLELLVYGTGSLCMHIFFCETFLYNVFVRHPTVLFYQLTFTIQSTSSWSFFSFDKLGHKEVK
jgi:hypothetical protein